MKEKNKTIGDNAKVLIVEDEDLIAKLIRFSLSKLGYECIYIYDGIAVADMLAAHNFDLRLSDIMLPVLNGYEVLAYAKNVEVPVICLTAMGNTAQKVKGLRAEAETVLRRYHKAQRYLFMHDVVVGINSGTVTQNGAMVELTLKEYGYIFKRRHYRDILRKVAFPLCRRGSRSLHNRT